MYPFQDYLCPIRTTIKIDVYEDGLWDLYINDKQANPIEFSLHAKTRKETKNLFEYEPLITYTETIDPLSNL